MKTTLGAMGVCLGFLLVAALSMGNRMYLLLALILLIALVLAYISVRMADRTVKVSGTLSRDRVTRGERVDLEVAVSHKGLLPIAPVSLKMRQTSNTPSATIHLTQLGRRSQKVRHSFVAAHVGAMCPGVESFKISDVFGFFGREHQPQQDVQELLVLPVPFEVEPLEFAAGDMGVETMKRAMEDPSSPAGFRSYQLGDPLKRIHWKMSARKREPIVREFEEPALPDALVLLDTSPVYTSPGVAPEQADYLQDALLETAASVVSCQIKRDNPVRMPLVGDRPLEYSGSMGVPLLLEELARVTFNETERFERVVMLRMGGLRGTGAIAVITTRLTGALVDLIARIKRMGPNVRLYLITFRPDDPSMLPLVARLQHSGVEVNYVKPQQG